MDKTKIYPEEDRAAGRGWVASFRNVGEAPFIVAAVLPGGLLMQPTLNLPGEDLGLDAPCQFWSWQYIEDCETLQWFEDWSHFQRYCAKHVKRREPLRSA